MKKIFLLLLVVTMIVMSFSSCKTPESDETFKNDETPGNKEAFENQKTEAVKFDSGTYFDKNWGETVGTYDKSAVPDKETALKIAEAVFDGMDKDAEMQSCEPQSVFYDEQDEIWIVSFGKKYNDSGEYVVGGGCSIAIQKADGKVLRIWFGE